MANQENPTAIRIAVKRRMQITVTIAESRFAPVSYNTFGVGPFSATVTVEPGEVVQDVIDETKEVLVDAARREHVRAVDAYAKALRYNDRVMRGDQ